MIPEGHHHEGWTPISDGTSKVFVIGDDRAARRSLEKVIRTAGRELEVFASAEDFLSCERCTVPCCVIINLTVPGLSGLELQKRLADRSGMPIIFIAGNNDVLVAVQAMKAGAVEFLIKPFNEAALIDAIGTAIERSRAALNRELDMRMLRTRYASLSPRQREVMVLVVSGLLNKQIGGELGISEITVKAHRGFVMRKMEASSLPDLVRMAAQLELRHLQTKGQTAWTSALTTRIHQPRLYRLQTLTASA